MVYLVRATVALPFGPDSALPSAFQTEALRQADGVVAVSEYVAQYTRHWGGLEAIHVPISLLDPGGCPQLGRFDNRFVTMVNPCAVKGISIFLALAERFPGVEFAAVPTWGTTAADFAALRKMPNISVLAPVDDIDDLLRQTRVMLAPSLWAEARSRMILEAMSRGIPVMASDVGGLAEAMLGIDYLLPVNPVAHYRSMVDELMVPAVEDSAAGCVAVGAVLERLLTDRAHYEHLSARPRGGGAGIRGRSQCRAVRSISEKVLAAPESGAGAAAERREPAFRRTAAAAGIAPEASEVRHVAD